MIAAIIQMIFGLIILGIVLSIVHQFFPITGKLLNVIYALVGLIVVLWVVGVILPLALPSVVVLPARR